MALSVNGFKMTSVRCLLNVNDLKDLKDPISYVSRSPILFFNGDFCMNLYSVDSYKAMKHLTVHRFNV